MQAPSHYAHVAQDACGILTANTPAAWAGLTTDRVETCIVYCFVCEGGVAMVHDSGQLAVAGIAEAVAPLGKVTSVKALMSTYALAQMSKLHDRRRRALAELLNFSELDVHGDATPQKTFAAAYHRDSGRQSAHPALLKETASPADIAYRWVVAKLNYTFMETDAQNLPTDIQFDGTGYCPTRGPIHSLEDVLQVIAAQPQYFFMNLSVLLEAEQAGIHKLPEPLLAYAAAHGVRPGDFAGARNQETAHHLFLAQGFAGT